MRILLYCPNHDDAAAWARDVAAALPQALTQLWRADAGPVQCDYAIVWAPPAALVAQLAGVKAIFLMGAGVDSLLRHGAALPDVPIVRLGDAGMGEQMANYVSHAVLHYFRRRDDYARQAQDGVWLPLPPYEKRDFTVGVLGMGQLGLPVARQLRALGFPVRAWSRSPKQVDGVASFAGMDTLDDFLAGTRVLVCMLPLTPQTAHLLDRARLARLAAGAYLVNVARGALVVEADLLALLDARHIAGATLDVFEHEPLPPAHPFWRHSRVMVTPHVAALTLRPQAVEQIVAKIGQLEQGLPVADVVDRARGY